MTDTVSSKFQLHAPPGPGVGQPVVRPRNGFIPKLLGWLFDHSELFLPIIRDFLPIIVIKKKKLAFVTRNDDVKEIFLADDAFGVPYAEKLNVITGGVPFLLGMEDSTEYRRDLDAMRRIIRVEDIATRLAPATEKAAEQIVAESNGRMDILKLSRDATFDVLLDYFGTPAPAPHAGDIVVWSTRLFESIFHIGKPEPELDAEVALYAPALLAHIDRLIKERKDSGLERDDVLGRCLKLQDRAVNGFSDIEIRGALAGFIVAGLPQPPMVLPKVVEQLLRRSKVLAQAQEAARRDDDLMLANYVFEAMRFDPLAPFLQRVVKRDHVLADSTFRQKKLEKGTKVFILTASAMMDERRVRDPGTFEPNRSANDRLLFGYGLHQCFGIHMNQKLIPLMLKPLLKKRGLRRADGPEGHLRKQSVFPDRLTVCFDPDPGDRIGASAVPTEPPIVHASS